MKKTSASRKNSGPSLPLSEGTVEAEAALPMIHCTICGSDTQAGSAEQMCWVCRRLKISAWRDVEQQMPAQE
jgi:hypothetical protein